MKKRSTRARAFIHPLHTYTSSFWMSIELNLNDAYCHSFHHHTLFCTSPVRSCCFHLFLLQSRLSSSLDVVLSHFLSLLFSSADVPSTAFVNIYFYPIICLILFHPSQDCIQKRSMSESLLMLSSHINFFIFLGIFQKRESYFSSSASPSLSFAAVQQHVRHCINGFFISRFILPNAYQSLLV